MIPHKMTEIEFHSKGFQSCKITIRHNGGVAHEHAAFYDSQPNITTKILEMAGEISRFGTITNIGSLSPNFYQTSATGNNFNVSVDPTRHNADYIPNEISIQFIITSQNQWQYNEFVNKYRYNSWYLNYGQFLFESHNNNYLNLHELIRANPNTLKLIDNPSEDLINSAINSGFREFEFFGDRTFSDNLVMSIIACDYPQILLKHKNPSDAVLLYAANRNSRALHYIDNPSEDVQLAAIRKYPESINKISRECLTDRVIDEVIIRKPTCIKNIAPEDQTTERQLMAIRGDTRAIDHIYAPSFEAWSAAIDRDAEHVLRNFEISTTLILKAIKINPALIKFVANPTTQMMIMALKHDVNLARIIKDKLNDKAMESVYADLVPKQHDNIANIFLDQSKSNKIKLFLRMKFEI